MGLGGEGGAGILSGTLGIVGLRYSCIRKQLLEKVSVPENKACIGDRRTEGREEEGRRREREAEVHPGGLSGRQKPHSFIIHSTNITEHSQALGGGKVGDGEEDSFTWQSTSSPTTHQAQRYTHT